ARLLHDRISAGDFAIELLVREMIGQLNTDEPITVSLHPDDLELLQRRLDGRPLLEGDERVRLVADVALGRGGCRVESKDDMILAELEEQLADMRRQLMRSLGNAQT